MNYQNLKIDGYEIQETECLGQGSDGRVYACKSLKQGEQNLSLCIKLITNFWKINYEQYIQILNFTKDKHPNNKNLLKILEVKKINCDNGQLTAIVMERYKTDLRDILFAEKKVFTNQEVVDFLQQILQGYSALYEESFVYDDFRPSKIKVSYENEKPIYKLNYCWEKIDKIETLSERERVGIPAWVPPEIRGSATQNQLLIQDFRGTVKTPINPNVDQDLAQLIEKMIVYLPSQRITFQEVVRLFGKKEPNVNFKASNIDLQPQNLNTQNQFQMPQTLIGVNQYRVLNNNPSQGAQFFSQPTNNFQPQNCQPFPPTDAPNKILINPQSAQQQDISLDFLCPYHSEKILFLNLNAGVSKGNRTLCVRCQLIYPTNLDVAIQQWDQYKVAQRQKVEETYTQILNPMKATKKQLTSILEAITTLQRRIIQQKQKDIQLIEEFDRNITISKLQDIAEVVADKISLTKNDYLQTFVEKLGVAEKNLTFELKNYESVMNSMRQESDILEKKQQALDLLQKGRNLKQMNQCDKALELLNQSPIPMHELHNEIGLILQIQNRHQQAIEFFDKALDLDPQSAQYYKNKGDSLVALGQLIDGKQCYEQALKINPNYLEAQQAIQKQ